MAQELEDGEFWLPSDFLTDDDLLTDFKTDHSKMKRSNDFSHGFGSSFGFSSDLSSPVESVMGSNETESDEDDFVAGLNRKIAHSTFLDSNLFSDENIKEWKLSSSPQSTLCVCKQGPSPNSVTRVSSPPAGEDVVGWDLLHAAAEEVARMRVMEETSPFLSSNVFAPPPKPISGALPVKKPTPTTGFYQPQPQPQSQTYLPYLQLQAAKFQQMKQQQQQMMKRGVWGQGKLEHQFQNGKMAGEPGRTQGLSMASWPTLQQSQQQQQQQQERLGSGMRAVFLSETGVKKERTGTGVFLPRRFGTNPPETRKKPGYSTVLLPDRVVHALNLNMDSIDDQSQHRGNRNFIMTNRQPEMNHELGFSQQWTY